ncbi:MAG: Type I Iterative PKS [Alyxoria varia]|nr:MAG: Type I Iterative PKS [Alyxoria varia]
MATKDANQDRVVPPIAIIGIGCRFPGDVIDTETLWRLLSEGRDTWSETPPERFNERAFLHPHPDQHGAYSHRGGHFLRQDISAFDADFFKIPRPEALALDPEQRLSLETTYEALENAGITLEGIRGSQTSVYFANFTHDYDRNIYKDPMDIPNYHTTGSGQAIISNRLSYFFDLRGPSMTLDTGCSGGTVAIHQACQSLRTRETDTAIAGGVNMIMSPDHMLALSKMHMLNENGKSYPFDARGSGYGRGEGCATVVLKRLDDALLAGDPVRAVIRNTGVNQDGKTNGITLPNEDSQAFLANQTYANASINTADVDYIEAHGTGTAAGDLAEVNAIAKVFGKDGDYPLLIGSIKSNIGHLEACSGLAGLIKAVLVLEKGEIPATINHEVPRPELKLHERNIKVPTELLHNQFIHRVSVNSFGYGGTNGHLILEKSPLDSEDQYRLESRRKRRHEPNQRATGPYLLVLSASSSSSMTELIRKLKWWTPFQKDRQYLADLAYTLSSRRSVLNWRLTLVAKDDDDFKIALNSEALLKEIRRSKNTRTVFLFTGQGAQWHAMGFELIETSRQFRRTLEHCQEILRNLGAPWNLIEELSEKHRSRIDESEIAQPATTALQLALVECLRDVGVRPHCVVGHSSGEIAAAYAAGILSMESAIKISYLRGFASDISKRMSSEKCAMLAVGLGEDEIQEHVRDISGICIGCVNSSQSVTLSGNEEGISKAKRRLDSLSIFNRALKVDTAYHSHYMQLAARQYLDSLNSLAWEPPKSSVRFISSVTGQAKTSGFGPTYWVDNLTSQVRYHHAISEMCRLHQRDSRDSLAFIELGPHAALSGPTAQILRANFNALEWSYQSALYRDKCATQTLLQAIGNLFAQGCDIKIERAYKLWSSTPGCVLRDLPTYPWDHTTKFWHESRLSRNYRLRRYPNHDLLGVAMESSTPLELFWRHFINTNDSPWLSDHVVNAFTIFPGAGYLCMAFEAMRQIYDLVDGQQRPYKIVLKNVRFLKALIVPKAPERVELHLHINQYHGDVSSHLNDNSSGWYEFRISALVEGNWNQHCRGFVKIDFDLDESTTTLSYPVLIDESTLESETVGNDVSSQKPERSNAHDLYEAFRSSGNSYGPYFSVVENLEVLQDHEARSSVRILDIASSMPASKLSPHLIHPTTLDALMHASLALYYNLKGRDSIMPLALDEMSIVSNVCNMPGEKLLAQSTLSLERARRGRYSLARITVPHPHHATENAGHCIEIKDLELCGLGIKPLVMLPASTMHQKIEWRVDADYRSTVSIEGRAQAREFTATEVQDLELEEARTPLRSIEFVTAEMAKDSGMHSLIHILCGHLTGKGHRTSSRNLDHTWQYPNVQKSRLHIVIESSSSPIMSGLTEATFSNIVQLVRSARDVLWLTVSDTESEYFNPERDLITGFARSAHAENEELRLVRIDVQQNLYSTLRTLPEVITDVIYKSFEKMTGTLQEREYVYKDDQLFIPRLVPNEEAYNWLNSALGNTIIGAEQFHQCNGQDRLILSHANHDAGLIFEQLSDFTATPLPNEVEIQPRAISLSPGVLNNTTKYSPSPIELSGEIISVGKNVTTVSTGDRVCAWAFAVFSNRARVPAQNVHKLPNTVSLATGASMPAAFAAAYCCYTSVLRTKQGQVVLINHAISAVGQALLTLARPFGLKAIAVVKNAPQVDVVMQNYGSQLLGVLTKRPSGFAEEIRLLTKGNGVDAVANCSIVDVLEEGAACLAPFGTFAQMEFPRLEAKPYQSEWRPSSNVTYSRLNIARLFRGHPKHVNESLATVLRWLDDGTVLPVHSMKIFPIEELNNAVQEIKEDGILGKLVLQASRSSTIQVARTRRPQIALDSYASYIIAGGLGYIGRRLCRLLVERGAKHLVVLSRRARSSPRQQELERDLRSIDAGLNIHWKQCDIGDRSQVDRVAKDLILQGAPRVKGIVQATVVLKDCTLENMTIHDYEVSLHNKVHGTKNLNDIFSNPSLAFFLSLSSTTGVVGSRGQANYSAANTYLDSFANAAPKTSAAHYVTVDIGMVRGSDVNETTSTVNNLTRQGLTTIEMKELMTLLEYAISPECRDSGCNQVVSGIESASIARVNIPNSNAKSAMFSDMWQDVATESGPTEDRDVVAFQELVSEAEDMQEVHRAAIKSISRKLTKIVVSPDRSIDPESSMTDLGLDSLVTMELRNWINKEFQAAVSASDVLDQPTLGALAEHVISISEMVKKAFGNTGEGKGEASNEPDSSLPPSHSHGDRDDNEDLSTLPVPDLHYTMRQMRESRESFMTPTEHKRLRQIIDDFCAPSGSGTRLQQRLIERSQQGHWQQGLYREPIYLARRESPYPNTIFFAGHLVNGDIVHSQARRAAIISSAALRFKQRLEEGLVSPDVLNEESLSMFTWQWLFNGSREPRDGVDKIRSWHGDYLIVLRRGHVFKINLQTKMGQAASVADLEATFVALTGTSEEAVPAIATLTSDNRETWAKTRNSLMHSDRRNSLVVNMIERAAFVVSLDDGAPKTPSKRCNQFFLGDSTNRWTDKTMHFVVCQNGVSAMVCEHSMLDGLSVKALHAAITEGILSDGASTSPPSPVDSTDEWEVVGSKAPSPSSSSNSVALQPDAGDAVRRPTRKEPELLHSELSFYLSGLSFNLNAHIEHLRSDFASRYAPIELTHHTIESLSATYFRSHRISPKTGFQLVIQLACLHFYDGEQPESWEAVSLARFHQGRVDWIQAVDQCMKSFCSAAAAFRCNSDQAVGAMLRNMLFEAANSYTNRMTKISRGHGFVAHLYALLALAQQEESENQTPLPELFRDPQWEATSVPSVKRVKTDCVEGLNLQETCFLMPAPECIYVHFEPKDEGCKFFVQTWPGLSLKMCEALDWAVETIVEILG